MLTAHKITNAYGIRFAETDQNVANAISRTAGVKVHYVPK